jgi:hypothetical protein
MKGRKIIMERINLSDFKAISKYQIIEGIFKKVEKSLDGKELEFFGVNEDTVKALTEKKIGNDDISFLFELIPIISNVNIDVDIKEFEKMAKTPSLQFAEYISLLLQHFKELYTTASKLNSLEKDVKTSIKDLGLEIPKEIPKEKTKEEQLDELYSSLDNCKEDKANRREILKQIAELENE